MQYIKQFPHCDPRILHAPGECDVCDLHPEWQELREVWCINFTGKRDCEKTSCPAEVYRNKSTIEAWPDNRPYKKGNI